jgi:hypothetical protein
LAEKKADRRERERPGFDEMARSIHASYLSRWNRHDPAGLERASAESRPVRGERGERSSAA